LWLSPIQIWVVPISLKHEKYANKLGEELKKEGFRIEVKNENETISRKIRDGEIQKIPYILVVGDKEIKAKSVRIRKRGKGDIGMVSLKKFLKGAKMDIMKGK
jgi:threonyl-tRNA synthetase